MRLSDSSAHHLWYINYIYSIAIFQQSVVQLVFVDLAYIGYSLYIVLYIAYIGYQAICWVQGPPGHEICSLLGSEFHVP
jgi:hypothetical protein